VWIVDMISGTQLLEVDLRQRSVRTLMESPHLIGVGMLTMVPKVKAAGEKASRVHYRERLAVRTTDRVVLFDATGKQHSAFVIPQELRERSFCLYELGAGKALITAGRQLPDRGHCEDVAWIDASGGVSRRIEVHLAGRYTSDESSGTWQAALAFPAPAMLAFLATVFEPLDRVSSGLDPTYSAALAWCLAAWWPTLAVVTLLAALLAWYCCRRHRRFCQPTGAVWFVFVLLAGVPGLVAYLFHRRWPVLERCPACGHVVPRDRETCARCGAAFPAPAPTGCEVFA
jgi:hypothetical protein